MISANISKETRKRVYQREGWACAVCSSNRQLEVHHIIKRSRGGSNDVQNLVCLCHDCHCIAHGERVRPLHLEGVPVTAEDVELAIVEYMADYYAETRGEVWWPWSGPSSASERDRRRHARWPEVFRNEHLEEEGF